MQAALIFAFVLLTIVGLVTVGAGRMDTAPLPGPRDPRPMVVWTVWIGGLNLALNASSLVWFWFVFPSIVAALLFWLLPYLNRLYRLAEADRQFRLQKPGGKLGTDSP